MQGLVRTAVILTILSLAHQAIAQDLVTILPGRAVIGTGDTFSLVGKGAAWFDLVQVARVETP